MVTQFSEAERALGACDPSDWHDLMHNPEGICRTMKTFYASQGKLDRVKWMSANCEGEAMGEDAMTVAASNGHLDVVRYLREHLRVQATSAAIVAAAGNGHLDVVRYLHESALAQCSTEDSRCSKTCARVDSHESDPTASIQDRPRLTIDTSTSSTNDSRDEDDDQDECPICCEDLTDPFTTACRHTFCTVCLFRWLETKSTCPACRQPIDILSPVEANGREMSEAIPFEPSQLEEEDGDESPRHFSLSELEDEIARVSAAHRTASLIASGRGNVRPLDLQTSSPPASANSWSYTYLGIDREQEEPERFRGRYRLPSYDDGDYRDPRYFEPQPWPSQAEIARYHLGSVDIGDYRDPRSPTFQPHRWPSP
ncbi:hypothetical protein PHYSODRAFT_358215 [Phytophthora sojae]|uniref:RING-type domain-containing protein n=1 Tax=Phytophthora sojae (strain P6497) TaxID=1094619 RepID=G4YI36_PHYSP|nr:hypothetical protein PHYSODRAFT_358215 [Phytophthora sojae]EGZ27047.1 hypothetical protein PHYSODRAFT_358215 [Phytophthora sojae]|eukprot:XP_009514322.1 hypothetical protein PHYSODRAFT_358215 [Phytophthora sojae]